MKVEFHDAEGKLSAALLGVSGALPVGTVSLRDLLGLIGEQGTLLVCVFLTLPFCSRYPYRASGPCSGWRSS